MLQLEGYRLGKCLHSLPGSEVYAATRERDGREVVLKGYSADRSLDASSRAQRELDIIRRISSPRVIRALEVDRSGERPVLVLERFRGISLDEAIGRDFLPIERFLRIGLELAAAVGDVHAARVLHKDLKPSNILIDPTSDQVCLADFGLAREFGQVTRSDQIQGTLAYIAPEQTGRMDRGVDHRSDLYSLGATFYHLLVGRPPFDSQDPLELTHAHIARLPQPPLEHRPNLPPTLSRIVMKLLMKEPEDRYQTARALHTDLLQCRAQLERTGLVDDDLPLGTADVPIRPLFRKKLYGRERESEALCAAYQNAASGTPQVLLVRGAAGVGKSALVSELRRPIANSGGYLAQGKFDQYRRDLPYAGLLAALDSLVHQLLAGSEERLLVWRRELMGELGYIAQVLVELVPDLGLVLGECPPVPRLGPRESQQRLALVLQRFLAACAVKSHPLVLFLDDLQWADAGSRYLLEELLIGDQPPALLLLGAYRDGEVSASHPLAALLARLEEAGEPIQILELQPLCEDACTEMLADALGAPRERLRTLAQTVALKTGNSPLLIQQFVGYLHDLNLIRFEAPDGWAWDGAGIAAAPIPEGAVPLLASKLDRLGEAPGEMIRLASCVGDEFSPDTLAALSELPQAALESALFALAETGLIAPCTSGFRFVHDRIREAAQSLLSEEQRAALHYRIGQMLLASAPEATLAERVFEIADHFNRARALLSEDERVRLLQLDLSAGQRALASGAADTAARYLEAGRALFRDSDWQDHGALGFELFLQSAEAAFQTLAFEAALDWLKMLEAQPLPVVLASQVAGKQLAVYQVMKPAEQVLPIVLATLRRFGVRWPERPSRLRTWFEILRADWILRGPLDERLFRGRAPPNPEWLGPLLIIRAGGSTITRTSIRLACICMSHVLRTFVRGGISTGVALAFAAYAGDRLAFLGHARGALRYLEAGLEWCLRMPDPVVNLRVEYIALTWVKPWLEPRRRSMEPLRRLQESAQEIGDLELAAGCAHMRKTIALLVGTPLPEVLAMSSTGRMALGRSPAEDPARSARAYELLMDPAAAAAPELDAEIAGIGELAVRHSTSAYLLATHWAAALCFLGRYAQAFALTESLLPVIFEIQSFSTHVADFVFYRGFAAAALAPESRGAAARGQRRALRLSAQQLARWARSGPDFAHTALALQAERAALRGQLARAIVRYAQAVERAAAQGHRHHAALFCERRAALLRRARRSIEAAAALRHAQNFYREWGAAAKVAQINPQLHALSARRGKEEQTGSSMPGFR